MTSLSISNNPDSTHDTLSSGKKWTWAILWNIQRDVNNNIDFIKDSSLKPFYDWKNEFKSEKDAVMAIHQTIAGKPFDRESSFFALQLSTPTQRKIQEFWWARTDYIIQMKQ